jgi:hypothetical protein
MKRSGRPRDDGLSNAKDPKDRDQKRRRRDTDHFASLHVRDLVLTDRDEAAITTLYGQIGGAERKKIRQEIMLRRQQLRKLTIKKARAHRTK